MKQETKATRGIFEKTVGSGQWWIRYTDCSGKYRREVAGTWSQARNLLDKRRGDALAGRKLPEKLRRRAIAFREIADDALVYSRAHKRSFAADESNMKHLIEWFGDCEAESLTGPEMEKRLEEAKVELKWANSTFNHHRSLLLLAYREARRAKKVQNNPARDIRHKKENNSRVRFLSRGENGEFERLMKVLREQHPEHLSEFTFSIHTGLRLASQYTATWEMIDFMRNELNLPRTKTGEEALHVPLNSEAMAALRSLPSWKQRKGAIFRNQQHPEKPVRSNTHWFKAALKAAGITNYKWHDNRHSFASALVQSGVPLDRVSKLLGHGSLTMTARYAHLAPNQLHQDVELLATNSTTVAPEPNRQEVNPVTVVN